MKTLSWVVLKEFPAGFLYGIGRDVTEARQSELALKKSNQQLELLSRELGSRNKQLLEFTHIISHNLRAPASNLSALFEMLGSTSVEDEKREYLSHISGVISGFKDTLNNLMEVLQINDQTGLKLESLEFLPVFDKTRALLSGWSENLKATIEADFSALASITYSKVYLESIFLNLMSNALKYADPARKPVISFKTGLIDDKPCLSVSDNGLGIDLKRFAKKIFGFHQTFHRTGGESKGLGLYLTRTQINSLGGEISVESMPGKGTTFHILFKA